MLFIYLFYTTQLFYLLFVSTYLKRFSYYTKCVVVTRPMSSSQLRQADDAVGNCVTVNH